MPIYLGGRDSGPIERGILAPRVPPPDTPGLLDTLAAAFRTENTVGSFMVAEGPTGPLSVDPDYEPWSRIPDRYREQPEAYIWANTDEEVEQVTARLDRQNRDRQTLAAAGGGGLAASFAAALIDPINLIPVGGAAYRASRVGNMLQGGLATMRAGLLGASAAEVALHASQETRTWGESATNVAGAVFLSGILGGAAGALRRTGVAALAPRVERDLTAPADPLTDTMEPGFVGVTLEDAIRATEAREAGEAPVTAGQGGSVGAATARLAEADARLESMLGAERTGLLRTSPMGRTAMSESLATRQIAQELVETPFRYRENALGIASPVAVETRVKMWQAPLSEAIQALDRAFVEYRLGRTARTGDKTAIRLGDLAGGARRGGLMTFHQFREEVGRAMRRGDTSSIPQVAAVAREMRRLIFDPLKDRAIAAKLLPEGVTPETAPSYLTRVWNVERIIHRRPELAAITMRWLRANHPEMDDLEIERVANEIIDKLISAPGGRIPYETVPLKNSRALKERTFTIPDRLIEDFLESDVEQIARYYTRTMAPDVELAERFGRADMQDQINRISESYTHRRAEALTEAQRKALDSRRQADVRDIAAMRDRLRGTYAAPEDPNGLLSRSVTVIKDWNYTRLLGGMTVSSLADVARPVMTEGLMRTLGRGVVPLIAGFRGFRAAAREVRLAGTALDMVLDSRATALADIGDQYGRHSRFERGSSALARQFGAAALMSPWNASMKQFSGVIVSSRILDHAARWAAGNLGRKGIARLAESGIDEEMARRIAVMFARHGEDGPAMIARTDLWEDTGAVAAFRAALVREVDRVIVTPGIGDRPLVASRFLGSPLLAQLVFQFRTFSMAAVQRVLLAGLQQRDMATLNGLLLSIALGMGVYALKTQQSDRDLSDDPRVWIKEGLDRSGVLGWLFDANNIVERLSRGTVGVGPLTGTMEPMSRFASRSALGSLTGPTGDLAGDIFQLTGAASVGEWTDSDNRAAKRLVPYLNLFYIRALLDQMEPDSPAR